MGQGAGPLGRGRLSTSCTSGNLHAGENLSRPPSEKLDRLGGLGLHPHEIHALGPFGGDRGWAMTGVLAHCPPPSILRTNPPTLAAPGARPAHGARAEVVADVFFNHFGPGRELSPPSYAPDIFFFDAAATRPFGRRHRLPKGPRPPLFIENALYWLDGIRLRTASPRRHRTRSGNHVRGPELLIETGTELCANNHRTPTST